ncbi:MAG: ATP-binding protein [Candidatus Altiarchaeota archaeon]|nr:ATP-binding protein [Candidatus Altiarchaeota archaeon]
MNPETLKKWNPWWVYGSVPEERRGIRRDELLEELSHLINAKEIVGITGVRRGGKSTILYQLIDILLSKDVPAKNILYFNFDEPLPENDVYTLDRVHKTFLELNNPQGRQYLFLDEIQNIREWERWVKTQYDLKGEKLKFFVTGSNTSMLSDSLAKLLTGRLLSQEIYPLSFREYLTFNGFKLRDMDLQKEEIKHHLMKYLEEGGFPETVLDKNSELNRQRLREYFNSILFRDIVSIREIKESAKLAELSEYVATNITGIFSYNKISKTIKLNINTMKEYLHYLQQAYLIFQVNYFSYSLKETLAIQKPKKMYMIDNGMRNSVAARFTPDEGKLAENLVFMELKRRGFDLYFWKAKNGVDFITKDQKGSLQAINVTYGTTIEPREKKGLKEFRETFREVDTLIITRDIEKTEDEIKHIPLWKWLLQNAKTS